MKFRTLSDLPQHKGAQKQRLAHELALSLRGLHDLPLNFHFSEAPTVTTSFICFLFDIRISSIHGSFL